MKKKIALILCAAFLLPLLSACGKEPESTNLLTCSDRQLDGAFTSDTIIKYNFDGTEVVGTDLKAVIDLSGRSVKDVGCTTETIEQCVKDLIEQMKSRCSGQSFIENCQITNQSEYGFTFTANVKSDALADYFSPVSLQTTKEQMKEKLVSMKNYDCR